MKSVITVTGCPYISTGKNKAEYNREETEVSYHQLPRGSSARLLLDSKCHLEYHKDYYWRLTKQPKFNWSKKYIRDKKYSRIFSSSLSIFHLSTTNFENACLLIRIEILHTYFWLDVHALLPVPDPFDPVLLLHLLLQTTESLTVIVSV